VHLRFATIVGLKLASARMHKQEQTNRQNQHHFATGLELAED
jgi:hypothetical protein